MKELGGQVAAQEEAVASVEAAVDGALAHTEGAVGELRKAASYVAAYRWKCVALALFVLLFVGVMLLLHFQFRIV
jgi:hypothetical protein